MKNFFLIFLCLSANIFWSCNPEVNSQEEPEVKKTSSDQLEDSFPKDWLGQWTGTLNIYRDTGLVQTLPMQLHLQPIEGSENFTWTIIYGEDVEKGTRNYELETIDASKGQYLIDEKNSIKIESYLLHNRLVSWYVVANNLIYISYEKKGDELHFEVVAGKQEAVSTTGNTKESEEEIPEVITYPIGTLQNAILRKK